MDVFKKPKATDERKGEIQQTSFFNRVIQKLTRREQNCPMDKQEIEESCPYGEKE